eukprot:m.236582 g.236582  ORF g.236582 m.236582 type:complete len:88 (+) comp40135_c2_seq3:279-542(+)
MLSFYWSDYLLSGFASLHPLFSLLLSPEWSENSFLQRFGLLDSSPLQQNGVFETGATCHAPPWLCCAGAAKARPAEPKLNQPRNGKP